VLGGHLACIGSRPEKKEDAMAQHTTQREENRGGNGSQPVLHQHGEETQEYETVTEDLPIGLSAEIRKEVVTHLNQVLADTMTLRDLYKKCHWQVSGPTFYQLHLLFDKHHKEQAELVDDLAERIQTLGGVSLAMAHDVAEATTINRPPKGREEVPVMISRLLEAHESVIKEVRKYARRISELEDEGTFDLLVSEVLRTNEFQAWFLSEHLVQTPLVVTQ
jgi:starvation-inducible DNA-binding protein